MCTAFCYLTACSGESGDHLGVWRAPSHAITQGIWQARLLAGAHGAPSTCTASPCSAASPRAQAKCSCGRALSLSTSVTSLRCLVSARSDFHTLRGRCSHCDQSPCARGNSFTKCSVAFKFSGLCFCKVRQGVVALLVRSSPRCF